jgi:G:T/U-mismatch repair DNA glycosylase
MRPNDFTLFFQNHPQITSICFNGATAEKIFQKLVLKNLPQSVPLPKMVCLPSTSPAHASLTVQQKYLKWHAQIGTLSQAQ